MANEFGLITYGDTSRQEDLTDLIANITPTDTPFFSQVAQGETVRNTLHEWQEDVLAARATNARIEGLGRTFQSLVTPNRIVNVTQIFQKDGAVSGTQKAVVHAGYSDIMAYHKSKKTKEFKNDIEFACINASLNTGASGTARQMNGVLALINTVTSSLQSNVLSETMYNDFLQLVYNEGGDIDKVFVGSWLKRKISGFTASATKNINAEDKRLTNTVSMYDGDFGTQQILKSRELNSTGASTAAMFGITSSQWRFGWLRRPMMQDVPLDGGDQDEFVLRGEGTLVCGANAANFEILGLHNSQ